MSFIQAFEAAGSHVILMILAVFMLAGFVKGVIGLGLPTVAIGLLSLVMTPVQAAVLLIVPSLVTNVWQMASGAALLPLLRRLWSMLLGVVAGTLAGSGFMHGNGGDLAMTALGVALMLYALVGLSPLRLRIAPARQRWWGPLVGVLTGLVTAATGVFVIPAVPYLQALELERDELIQALGLSFTVSTLALALNLGHAGALNGAMAGASVLAVLPALSGMQLGSWVRGHVSAQMFRRCFFIGLLLLGLHLASHILE